MKQTIYAPNTVPTANLAVNKSRLKIYKNVGSLPTYYLQKGQEFQIELANPTTSVVLAKIILNGKAISQGGLVLNPGQRVFLDRYLDVAKKFLFDTYEVSNSTEMKKAIENNGDIKVEFYREESPVYLNNGCGTITLGNNYFNGNLGNYNIGTPAQFLRGGTSTIGSGGAHTLTGSLSNTSNLSSQSVNCVNTSYSTGEDLKSACMDSLNDTELDMPEPILKKSRVKSASLSKKTIETGRVEQGSSSDQKFRYVNKNFEYFAFHTVEYKMLPVSQKVNTIADVNVKVYCRNCGAKLGKTDKFCGQCGKKA